MPCSSQYAGGNIYQAASVPLGNTFVVAGGRMYGAGIYRDIYKVNELSDATNLHLLLLLLLLLLLFFGIVKLGLNLVS
jgi:hypothetical protein